MKTKLSGHMVMGSLFCLALLSACGREDQSLRGGAPSGIPSPMNWGDLYRNGDGADIPLESQIQMQRNSFPDWRPVKNLRNERGERLG